MSAPTLTPFDRPAQHPLKEPILSTLWTKYRNTPRHQQVALGPSQIGEPCNRKLAYGIMKEDKRGDGGDPLASIIGTASHTWMEEACQLWNATQGRVDWITEARLTIVDGIVGNSDAFHVPTRTVVDWKFPGATALTDQRKNGPKPVYRSQAHLYGKGWMALGVQVKHVAICFFPRGGTLGGRNGMHIWSEPFDPAIADQALERYFGLVELAVSLDVEHFPERYSVIPAKPSHACRYCPWFTPGKDTGRGCPGFTKE